MSSNEYVWWKHGVIYQIYPRSYQDSNADGIGDLNGLIRRLDYLKALGVQALWISPFFPSPMADFGYDVANYTDIDPVFGDLAAFDRLIEEAHARDLKIILDYVPNHSSDQHPWFIESRSSRDNPKADWYYWHDGYQDADGQRRPPNNWLSFFGGSQWEWDDTRQQYYLHSFLKEQPDLNWRTPELEQAMLDVLRFWMARGVDGLRMDVIFCITKHPDLLDNPPNPNLQAGIGRSMGEFDSLMHIHDFNWPEGVQPLVSKIRAVLDEFPDRVAIGETYLLNPRDLVPYYGANLDGIHLPFNFMLMHQRWEAAAFRETIQRYYAALPEGGWPNFVLGSHDEHRLATRFGMENARTAAMLLLTLRGTPTLYYGDEIGMADVPIPPEKEQDPHGLRVPGLGLGRDPERTPIQWDATPNAGFSPDGVETWLPIAGNYEAVNVAIQENESDSMLNYYRDLLHLRMESPILQWGDCTLIEQGLPAEVLAYTRKLGQEEVLVLLNFGGGQHTLDLTALAPDGTRLGMNLVERVVSSQTGFEIFPYSVLELARLPLAPHEALLLRLL